MKIKRIELIGFKSFADRTLFPLHDGITCVVGPNGCGKSNIVDAFRWVLGEQSAKSLRGVKMEEVIFQGSAVKRQSVMADVTLILSRPGQYVSKGNSENGKELFAGGTSDELTVTRRLYRSGESEYLLNKSLCRLKDIRDIFFDAGLGARGYSILDAGKIAEIINARPQERRFLIEEVAGVMKYKVKKAEAVSKIESSKQNLQRINDIMYEVKRQINNLDRQAKKAERYKQMMEELNTIEVRIAKRGHKGLNSILNSVMADIDRLKDVDSAKRAELSTLENHVATKRLEVADSKRVFSEIEDRLHGKEKSISDTERQIAVLKANIENKEVDISRLASQQDDIEAEKEKLTKVVADLDDAEAAMRSGMAGVSSELEEKKEMALDLKMMLDDRELDIDNKRRDLFKTSEKLSNKGDEFHKLQSSYETLKYRESISKGDINNIKRGIEGIEKAVKESEDFIKNKTNEHLRLQPEREALKSEVERLRGDIENKKMSLSEKKEDLASNMSRLNSLKELIIESPLADLLEGSSNQGYTALSDVITVDKGFEVAVEATLSEKINSLVIDKLEDVISTIKIIRERAIERTTIFFYTGHGIQDEGYRIQDAGGVTEGDIVGRASDFISFQPGAAQIIKGNILQNTYIVKDLQVAINILFANPPVCRAHTSSINLVTLEGEVINSDGWISAGKTREILKRRREATELQETIDRQQTGIRGINDELNTTVNDLIINKESLKDIEKRLLEAEKDISLSDHTLKSQKDELNRKVRRLSSLEAEISTISQEKGAIEDLLELKAREIDDLEAEKNRVNDEITVIQQSLVETKAEYEEVRTDLTDMKLAVTSYREKMDALNRERDGINNMAAEVENKKELVAKEILVARERRVEFSLKLRRLEEDIKILITETDKIRGGRNILREAINSESQELISKGNSINEIRTEIDLIGQRLADSNSKALENKLRIEHIEKSVMQKHGLDIKEEITRDMDFDVAFSPSEDEKRINELNEKARELGTVNPGAIEEYEELKDRHDFLIKHQRDLTISIAELEEAISRMNIATKRRLREAYTLLRTKFSEVFATLFGGGGKADIILTDEENILESGLEIIAQLPGKRLQNLNLLSGGEKALTSLAILFAGFLVRPGPLCILDEVDAPLDEPNTARFGQMIRGLSNETQFIIITHRRATMEIADYIYGITMEEPGVSKVVSVRFSEAKA